MSFGEGYMNLLRELRKNKNGFVLVDGIIAVLIVAIGLSALAYMYTHSTGVRIAGERRQAAVQVAAQGMEILKKADNQDFDMLEDLSKAMNEAPPKELKGLGVYTLTSSVDDAIESDKDTEQKLIPVKVTVTWDDPNEAKTVLESYIMVKVTK